MADSADLLFRIKADSGQAKDELGRFKTKVEADVAGIKAASAGAFSPLGVSAGGAFPTINSLRASITAAIPTILAVGGAVIGAGTAIFGLTKQAADLGSKYHDLSLKTGLAVETLSGLDLQLTQSGTSTDALANSVVFLQKNLAGAARGNEELRTAFARVGITDFNAALSDSDGTLRAVIKALGGMADAGHRNALGTQIMGRAYKELAVFIADTGGDMDAVIAKARELGLVMSKDAADKADEFGDTLDKVNKQLAGVTRQIGQELMPVVLETLQELSRRLKEGEAGRRTFIDDLKEINDQGNAWAAWLDRTTGFNLTGFGNRPTPKERREAGAGDPFGPGGSARGGFANAPSDVAVVGTTGGGADAVEEDTKAKAKAAEMLTKARAATVKAEATAAETAYKSVVDSAEKAFTETGNLLDLIGSLKKAEADRWDARKEQFEAERAEIYKRTQEAALTAAEINVKNQEQKMAQAAHLMRMAELDAQFTDKHLAELQKRHARELELYDLRAREYIEHQKTLAQAEAITYAEAQGRITAEQAAGLEKRRQLLEAEKEAAAGDAEKQAELIHQLSVLKEQAEAFRREASGAAASATAADLDRLDESIRRVNETLDRMGSGEITPVVSDTFPQVQAPGPGGAPQEAPWVDPDAFEKEFGKPPDLSKHIDAMDTFKNAGKAAFGGVAQAFGSMIQAFALGEKGAAKSFGAMAKSAIASMAAQAAVSALFELAQGFAWLFINPPKAASHFTASAVFGIVAGMAGVGAALIPGGSGGSVAENAYGSSASGRTSERDRAIREGRSGGASDPNGGQMLGYMMIDVKHDDGHTERQMTRVWRRMGEFRDTVMASTVGTAPSS